MELRDMIKTLKLDSPRRVLVVEDNLDAAVTIVEFLSDAGHSVTTLLGIDTIRAGHAEGTDLSGERIEVSLHDFEVALLDHYILSRTFTGATLIAPLRAAGVQHILAMSSVDEANNKMKALGATIGIKKSQFLRMIAMR